MSTPKASWAAEGSLASGAIGDFAVTCRIQLPEEQMKRLILVCALLAIAACAQQPPPPPPVAVNPPPPPPPPTTYTVYFDYNSSRLDPTGREALRFAADAYRAGTPGAVQVTGYSDPSGSAGYNQRLSLRRANEVAGVLVQDGVPQSALTVSGNGETSNAPTPGRDRRVEVVLGGSAPVSMR
jgi:outer membrane protein OmpA-like peptidoglycan-associated protein